MKRLLLGSAAAAAFAVGFMASALADVDVTATIQKTKDISVTEHITINKDATISVTVVIDVGKAAEVDSLINQTNYDNEACENCAEKQDLIFQSVLGNTGVVTVNQAAGNNNNQGSVLTAAVDDFGGGNGQPGEFFGYAEAQAAVDQENGLLRDGSGSRNYVDSANIIFREGDIDQSINGTLGIAMVNQATGHMLNQANNIAVAVSLDADGGVALSEAELGQETSGNVSNESDVTKSVAMKLSVNGNQGVTLVNQGVGNMSNQANTLGVGAVVAVGSL